MVQAWSTLDFVLVWLGGQFGSALFAGVGVAMSDADIVFTLALVGQYVGIVTVFGIIRRRRGPVGVDLRGSDIGYAGLGLLFQIVIALALIPIATLLYPDGQPPQQVAEALATTDSQVLRIAILSSAVLIAPVVEELMYRGILLRALQPRGKRLALIVTAFVFSAVHALGLRTDRFLAAAALALPPLFLLGLVLAWITQRSEGRLGPAIMFHSGWNLLAAISLLIPAELLEEVSRV